MAGSHAWTSKPRSRLVGGRLLSRTLRAARTALHPCSGTVSEPALAEIGTRFTLPSPSSLELGRSEVAQRQAATLVHVDVVEEPARLEDTIIMALVIRRVNFLLSDCASQPLGEAVLPGLADVGNARLGVDGPNHPAECGAACRMPWCVS
jgi:hypothetical protein